MAGRASVLPQQNLVNKPLVAVKPPVPVDEGLDMEFKYYCIVLRELEPNMPTTECREKLMRWIQKLVDPLSSTQDFNLRVKRNRYLMMMCIAIITGNVGEFLKMVGGKHLSVDRKKVPPKVKGLINADAPDPIADAQGVPLSIAKAIDPATFNVSGNFVPEWEHEKYWEIRLQAIKDAEIVVKTNKRVKVNEKVKVENKCAVHKDEVCPLSKVDEKVGRCLDNQFSFLLTMCEYYQLKMPTDNDKINKWLSALAKIDQASCVKMKSIRNDYTMLLVGYLYNKELKGPFEDLPTEILQPLTRAVGNFLGKRDVKETPREAVPLNPASDTVEEFMNSVPRIEEGAFAFLSLSGNLFHVRS